MTPTPPGLARPDARHWIALHARLLAKFTASFATALALALTAPSSVLACSTALPARPVAEYRASTPVVLGLIEAISPVDLTVRVEVVFRGSVGSRLRLSIGPVDDWCAFPWGPPAVGARVLVAVVDPMDWEWPNSAVWTVDGQGRILSPPEAPWNGAPTPKTIAGALRTMGIVPIANTAIASVAPPERGAWPATLSDLVPWLVGLAWMVGWLRRHGSRPPLRQPASRCSDQVVEARRRPPPSETR